MSVDNLIGIFLFQYIKKIANRFHILYNRKKNIFFYNFYWYKIYNYDENFGDTLSISCDSFSLSLISPSL